MHHQTTPTPIERAAAASCGATVATFFSHPFDVLKITQQVKQTSLKNATLSVVSGPRGARGLYAGVLSGVQQRVMNIGPMFFFTELFAQNLERDASLGRGASIYLGAAASGYLGGVLCGPSEYRKVLSARGVPVCPAPTLASSLSGAAGMTRMSVINVKPPTASSSWSYAHIFGHMRNRETARHVLRRFHGAGVRNAIFDSSFFGLSHWLQTHHDCTATAAFGMSAATAVLLGYSIDVGAKKSFALPPQLTVPTLSRSMASLFAGQRLWTALRRAHAGLPIKIVEFSVYFAVVGLVSSFASEHLERARAAAEAGGMQKLDYM
jgi:hypothetical protein